MKWISLAVLALAGTGLAMIAFRSEAPSYVAPTAAEIEAHHPAPSSIAGAIPAGGRLLTFEVEGMCCSGCTGKLYERLSATPGFVEGAVRFEDGVAEVVVAEGADAKAFETALRFDKYSASLAR